MKKTIIRIILATIITIIPTGLYPVHANNNISVELNGQKLYFEMQPQIIDDHTMVPMRTIFETLGYTVVWKPAEQTIEALRGQQVIILTINSTKYSNFNIKEVAASSDVITSLKNATHELDIAPVIINDSTLVPLRAVSEMAGCIVSWDSSTQTVNITGKIYSKLDILNEYLINNCEFNNGQYVATYEHDNYVIIIWHNPSQNITNIALIEPLKEFVSGYSFMGHSFADWTIISLNNSPMCCTYETIGGEHIEEIIPTDFKMPISKGIYRTYPIGNSNSTVQQYYELSDKLISANCNIAFDMFNMYMAKNYVALNASDFGVVLDNY